MAPGVIFIPPLGLWHAFIIKLSRTLRFLLVESPVQKKNENVQFLAFCIRDHLPIKRPRKPLLSLYILCKVSRVGDDSNNKKNLHALSTLQVLWSKFCTLLKFHDNFSSLSGGCLYSFDSQLCFPVSWE